MYLQLSHLVPPFLGTKPVGSRLLRTNLMSPPTRVDTINSRLELVDTFMSNEDFFYTVLEYLSSLPDVDKMLTNIALVPRKKPLLEEEGSASATLLRIASTGISALVCVKTTLAALPGFASALQSQLDATEQAQRSPNQERETERHGSADDGAATVVTDRSSLLVGLGDSSHQTPIRLQRHHLLRAIIFSMMQPGLAEVFHAVSDIFTENTTFSRNANVMRHQECFALQCEENSMISVLRRTFLANVDDIYKNADHYADVYGFQVAVRYTTHRGYFLAVPADVGTDLPQIFLQPSVSGRFITCTTEEISSLNVRAQDNVQDLLLLTHGSIQAALDMARSHYDAIAALCDAVALLDMCHSFADNVSQSRLPWCRPVVSDNPIHGGLSALAYGGDGPRDQNFVNSGRAMMIRNGRYAIDVSKSGLASGSGPSDFIPNDTLAADGKNFTLVTGINGSGKSTYLKQVAIIVILAHCGSYVPAEQALIPIRDQLCTRIGNADDQENNISTFMLEMKETALICNNVTERSLVLVDELGRATSNEDGVAIAWSVSEYLLKKRAMTFFVTHYPQLSRLGDIYPSVHNMHLEASVSKGDTGAIFYTHKVKAGACSVSTDYGVELAAACGWPSDVLQTARSVESQVANLCSDHDLCEMQPLGEDLHHAYTALDAISQSLKALLVDERVQSFASMRSELVKLHQDTVPESDTELFDALNRLLYRESPKHHRSQSIPAPIPNAAADREAMSVLLEQGTAGNASAVNTTACALSQKDCGDGDSETSSLSTSSSESDSSDDSSTSSSDTSKQA
jgi:DNA mismatch repair protein MSH4